MNAISRGVFHSECYKLGVFRSGCYKSGGGDAVDAISQGCFVVDAINLGSGGGSSLCSQFKLPCVCDVLVVNPLPCEIKGGGGGGGGG